MYDRFTDRARTVMYLANEAAYQLNQEYIGDEHLLLALLKEGVGVAAIAMQQAGLTLCCERLKGRRSTR